MDGGEVRPQSTAGATSVPAMRRRFPSTRAVDSAPGPPAWAWQWRALPRAGTPRGLRPARESVQACGGRPVQAGADESGEGVVGVVGERVLKGDVRAGPVPGCPVADREHGGGRRNVPVGSLPHDGRQPGDDRIVIALAAPGPTGRCRGPGCPPAPPRPSRDQSAAAGPGRTGETPSRWRCPATPRARCRRVRGARRSHSRGPGRVRPEPSGTSPAMSSRASASAGASSAGQGVA